MGGARSSKRSKKKRKKKKNMWFEWVIRSHSLCSFSLLSLSLHFLMQLFKILGILSHLSVSPQLASRLYLQAELLVCISPDCVYMLAHKYSNRMLVSVAPTSEFNTFHFAPPPPPGVKVLISLLQCIQKYSNPFTFFTCCYVAALC